jgi:molybdenum cofactor cytidylyltransferase
MTGVLLLAAGQGRRFGSDKRFAVLADGRSLLEATLCALCDSRLPVLTCLQEGDEQAAALLKSQQLDAIHVPQSVGGMGSTLAAGVAAVPSQWQGVLVALADMPYIMPTTYRQLAQSLEPDGIVVPQYMGKRGHPVGFARCWFDELSRLEGDSGARNLLKHHAGQVRVLSVTDAGIHRDVDTPADL